MEIPSDVSIPIIPITIAVCSTLTCLYVALSFALKQKKRNKKLADEIRQMALEIAGLEGKIEGLTINNRT